MTVAAARSASRSAVPAAACAAVALVLGVLSIAVLPWYSSAGGESGPTFGDLHAQYLGRHSNAFIQYLAAPTYFSWLGYVLLALAVAGAVLCTVRPVPGAPTATAVVSLVAFGLTAWALDLYTLRSPARRYIDYLGPQPPRGFLGWLGRSGIGAWAMLLAFLLCLAAALLSRRSRATG